jgi:hypothetical protein
MNRNKNLAYAVGAFLALMYVAWAFFGKGGAASAPEVGSPAPVYASPATSVYAVVQGSSVVPSPLASLSPLPGTGGTTLPPEAARSSYALLQNDLSGLPPDASPGTRLELWVAWDPPVTKNAKLQLLLRDVMLERIIPGVTSEAPSTVLLSIRSKDIADMLWADRYGALSVVVTG